MKRQKYLICRRIELLRRSKKNCVGKNNRTPKCKIHHCVRLYGRWDKVKTHGNLQAQNNAKRKISKIRLVHVHPKGWMDEDGRNLWINKVWINRSGGLQKDKSLLVWDMFKAHMVDSIRKLSDRKIQIWQSSLEA